MKKKPGNMKINGIKLSDVVISDKQFHDLIKLLSNPKQVQRMLKLGKILKKL